MCDYFTPTPAWFAQITDTQYDTNLAMPAVNYTWYFTTAFAYARGSTRISCLPLTAQTLQEVRFVDPESGQPPDLASTGNYISEHTALHFTVPFYSSKSRVRITTAPYTPIGIASRLPPYDTPTTRVHISAGNDAQLGYYLGAPPLLSSGSAYTTGPFTGWNPAALTKPTSVEITGQPIRTTGLSTVLDYFGNEVPVRVDTKDGFTIFHTGNMAFDGTSWTRVIGDGALSANLLSDVTVNGVVNANIITVTPEITVNGTVNANMFGRDLGGTLQTLSTRQATDGSHTLPITIYAEGYGTPDIQKVSAQGIGGGEYALSTL